MKYPKLLGGYTKSGKPVYQYLLAEREILEIHPYNRGFSNDDHFDAYTIFTYLAAREYIHGSRDRTKTRTLTAQAYFHMHEISSKLIEMKRAREINNAFDLHEYGASLAKTS